MVCHRSAARNSRISTHSSFPLSSYLQVIPILPTVDGRKCRVQDDHLPGLEPGKLGVVNPFVRVVTAG